MARTNGVGEKRTVELNEEKEMHSKQVQCNIPCEQEDEAESAGI
jgi:hypothetical protein